MRVDGPESSGAATQLVRKPTRWLFARSLEARVCVRCSSKGLAAGDPRSSCRVAMRRAPTARHAL
eukprot:10549198-Alexandrium_andersonii.AAC.1